MNKENPLMIIIGNKSDRTDKAVSEDDIKNFTEGSAVLSD